MNLQLYLTPAPLGRVNFENKTAVVIDVLRSSTSICAMLMAGARGIIPTSGPGEAGEMWSKLGPEAAVLAGERGGIKIENFQYGNSPAEFTSETVGGKYVIICTTNGTAVFARAQKAFLVIAAGMVNISRVAEAVARAGNDVIVVCSGKDGGFSTEDTLCGGLLISLLDKRHACRLVLNDAASLALLLHDTARPSFQQAIALGEHGRFLSSIGFEGDVEISSRVDSMPVLPVLKDGRLVRGDEDIPA